MTTIVIQLVDTCAGGGHFHLDATLDGGATKHFGVDIDEVDEFRNGLTAEDYDTALGVILKMYSKGKTRLQVRNALLAGLSVQIG